MILSIRFSLLFILTIVINGCTTSPPKSLTEQTNQTIEQRNAQLARINDWQLNGKIAFIQSDNRESASIRWQYLQSKNSQKLDLNSYLGINVLHLASKDNIHTIEVDGKSYQSDNLDQLITSLTGLTLPTQALTLWLKGLAFHPSDKITYSARNQLPSVLISEHNNQHWQIIYANYQQVKGVLLATKFTIKQNDLLIKISVKKWSL